MGVLPIEVPFLYTELSPNTAFDWNYTTTSQAGFDGHVVPYPRGRVLGGTSSISEYSSAVVMQPLIMKPL